MPTPDSQSGATNVELATFAAGCFWGIEAAYRNLPGVILTEVGYCGGDVAAPSYEEVCTGKTGHAESVRIVYDPKVTPYDRLLELFWRIHDPCSFDRQGPDVGSQYRSAIFYHTDGQKDKAIAAKDRLQKSGRCGDAKVATKIEPAGTFYRAEEYHQQYHAKHGRSPPVNLSGCAVGCGQPDQ
jgi:peptide-methionine (S)-S-oxide reductase